MFVQHCHHIVRGPPGDQLRVQHAQIAVAGGIPQAQDGNDAVCLAAREEGVQVSGSVAGTAVVSVVDVPLDPNNVCSGLLEVRQFVAAREIPII